VGDHGDLSALGIADRSDGMGHERWFRGQHDGQGRPFDWLTPARQQGIPERLARALYEQAMQQAHGAAPGRVQEIYLARLADARRDASRPSPGKVTRTMRLEAERAGKKCGPRISRLTSQPIASGKRTLTAYIEPARNASRASDEPRPAKLSEQDTSMPDALSERWLQAHLAAAVGHFKELDALQHERLAAELATAAEPSQPGDAARGDIADSEPNKLPLPSTRPPTHEWQASERLTDAGRPADDWGVAGLIRAAHPQEGPVVPGYLPGLGRGADRPGIAIHRKATDSAPLTDDAAERLRAAQGDSGTSLPTELSAELAEALGLSREVVAGVRVHTGSASAHAADTIAAEAFTIGADVHFAAGAYQPTTESGRRLIAHEVAHAVVAQPATTLDAGDMRVSEPDDTHERAADRFADTFTTHSRTRDIAVESRPLRPEMLPRLDTAPGATIHRYAAQHTEDEEEERKRREKRRGKDGELEQATGADMADGMQQSSGSDALAGGEQTHDVPDADDVTTQEERPRGDGPLDQAVAAAGGDAAREEAQRARKRDGALNPDLGPDGTEADSEQDEDGRTDGDRTQDAGDHAQGVGEEGGESDAALAPPDGVPPGGQDLVAPGAELDTTTAPAALGAQADGTGGGGDTLGSEQGGDADRQPLAQGSSAHDGGSGTQGAGQEVPATAASGSGEIDFAETDIHRLVPPQPDEPPEVYEQRIAVAREELAQDRAYAIGRLTEFRAVQGEHIATLSAMAPQIDHALTDAEQRATEQVSQAAAAQTQAVRAEVARAIQQAQTAAAAARSQIRSSYAATSTAINAATTTARNQITASYQQALAATRTAESAQIGEVGRLYVQAEGAFRAAANAAGSHATSVAGDRARTYRAGRINRDDSVLDGPLTDNRCEARAEAAEKVGQAYRDELVKEGDNQVNEMRQRKPTDEGAVRQVAEEARRNLETAYRESLRRLDEGRQRALAGARQVRDGALAGTSSTLQQTVSGLRRHERVQVANIDQQATAQKQALRRQRTQAARQLRGTLDRTITDLGAGLDQSMAAIRGAEVPEREALEQTLAQCSQAIEGQIAQLRAGIDQGREQIVQALGQGGTQSAATLTQAGSAAIASAQQTGAGAAQAIAQGAQAATASLQEMAATHQRTATQSAADAARGNTGITAGLDQAYTQLRENLQQGMQRNADAVRTGLIEVVDRDMGATITSEADEAAAQVQPRWKSVLKWVIIIAIVLVVAIVLGPMVIGAVTGLAAGLGASAAVAGTVGAVVGGALVGAGTAAVTTVVDNAFAGRTGWDLFQGVGTAMAWGALGGALGGGASTLLAGPMQGMAGMARYGIQVGVDMVIDTGISALSGNLSWENFGTSLLMSMLVNGVTSHPRVQRTSEGYMSRGYGAGFEGGIGLRSRLPNATPSPGPVSFPAGRVDHVARGDSHGPNSPNAGKWNVRGGGHVRGEIIPRANAEGVPHTTRATDPITGTSIEQFTRPSGAPQDKSLFPIGTDRSHVAAMGTEGLNRALTGAPGTTLTPPTPPNVNGMFTATVRGPNGHPIIVEGYYRPTAGGGEVQSVYPLSDLPAGTFPVVGGTGLGGSRTLPMPSYATPPATSEDR
jgi:hypothetical protein